MIKLLLDPQIFIAQKFGGISRYHTEVYDIIKGKDNIEINCPILFTENKHFIESPYFAESYQQRNALMIKYSKIFKAFRPSRLIQKTNHTTILHIKKQYFDVFIPTYYDPYFLDALAGKPFVLTVHDMIYELFPHYFHTDQTTVPNKKMLMEHAAKIIAVSENTKADILKIYPHIPASKIEVTYLASTIKASNTENLNLPEKYILFIGNRSLYKNFIFFLKSVAKILKEKPDLHIVCAGGGAFTFEETTLIHSLNIDFQVIQRPFEDSELPTYYKNARCFVFPSEYEGFGIPILEAMTCGCPVVLTNHSSFPEVAGDAGLYFQLNDTEDLANKIRFLLDDETARNEYAQKGLKQAEKFSWEKTAEESLNIYYSVLRPIPLNSKY